MAVVLNGFFQTSVPGLTITPTLVSGTGTVAFDVPLVFGTSLDLSVYLAAATLPGNGSDLVADALGTATLVGIELFDSSGRPLPFDLTADSGVIYTPTGVQSASAVPEPASPILLAAAGGLLAADGVFTSLR